LERTTNRLRVKRKGGVNRELGMDLKTALCGGKYLMGRKDGSNVPHKKIILD